MIFFLNSIFFTSFGNFEFVWGVFDRDPDRETQLVQKMFNYQGPNSMVKTISWMDVNWMDDPLP